MKNIFVYSPYWSTRGGDEKYILELSAVLSRTIQSRVTLLSASKGVDKQLLERFSNIDLTGVGFLSLKSTAELRRVVGNADCFICLSNVRKVRTQAHSHVQIIQIPYAKITPVSIGLKLVHGEFREGVKDFLRSRMLMFARDHADRVLTYSAFVHNVLEKNFGIGNTVTPPPIRDMLVEGYQKKNIILSVGRLFSGLYNNKRYDVLTDAFRSMCDAGLAGWEYHIIGTAATDHLSQRMIRELQTINRNYPVVFHVNESFDVMKRYYNEASIFWHAAGYEVDENLHPENVEHFGMTTVEAMSAKCIPIVIKKGGQTEIVTHEVNGFLWDTIPSLISRTFSTIHQLEELQPMRVHARERFHTYDVHSFQKTILEIFRPFLS
jgi:glycosyltransferase involved in cell wall biosynthesis